MQFRFFSIPSFDFSGFSAYFRNRPFCPGFCLKSLSFLTFFEKCKNQGSFCKCLIINKVFFLHLTEVMGEEVKTLTIFSSLAKNSVKFFSQKCFTRDFSMRFAIYPNLAVTAATRPLKRKKAARFLLPSDVNKLASIFANPGSYNFFQRACALLRRCRV